MMTDQEFNRLLEQTEADRERCEQSEEQRRNFFVNFWMQQSDWSQRTFGSDAERGPLGAIRHLQKEAKEVENAPRDLEEYVDCFFLTLDACRRAGFTPEQFIDATWAKLEKNKARQWRAPADPDQPTEHVR